MTAAKKNGFVTAPFSLRWTIIPITWIYLELVFNQSSAYIGGEVRRPGRVQIWSMPARRSSTAGPCCWSGCSSARRHHVPRRPGLRQRAALHFSTAPTYSEVASYATGNAVVAFLLCFAFIFSAYPWLPGQILNASRNLLAYGIDGVMRSWLANVNEAGHPVNALTVMGLGSIAALYFYTRPDSPFKTLTGIFGFILSFCITSVAAIVACPTGSARSGRTPRSTGGWARYQVMSIVGVLSLIAAAAMGVDYLNDPLSGITWRPERRRRDPVRQPLVRHVPAEHPDPAVGAG